MTQLALTGVSVELGGQRVLDQVDISIEGGELLGLIGANGAGKTTLMRVAAGLLQPLAGHWALDGTPLRQLAARHRAQHIAYLPQGAPCHWAMSVSRLVALGRLPHLQPWQQPGAADHAAVATALTQADVGHLAERAALTLSGGERAREMLARALAGEPRLLLADEPVAGLDPEHQLRVMETLQSRVRDGMGVMVTLHDLGLAARYCDRLVLLKNGRLLTAGSPQDVLSPRYLADGFHIDALSGERDGRPWLVPWRGLPDPKTPPTPTLPPEI
jgi:iron complex transport system ATP-binding protein